MKLSDTQLTILSAACQRGDRSVFPITAKVSGGALDKVLQSLIAKGLLEEVDAPAFDTAWRNRDEGVRVTLRATPAACAELGIEPEGQGSEAPVEPAVPAATPSATSPRARKPREAARASTQAAQGREPGTEPAEAARAPVAPARTVGAKTRPDTKQAQLIAMLRRPDGASLDEIVTATGWQKHTVRGAIAGALKKKLGLTVNSEKVEGRGRVYKLPQ